MHPIARQNISTAQHVRLMVIPCICTRESHFFYRPGATAATATLPSLHHAALTSWTYIRSFAGILVLSTNFALLYRLHEMDSDQTIAALKQPEQSNDRRTYKINSRLRRPHSVDN